MDIPTIEEFTDDVKALIKDLVGYISDEETETYIRFDRVKRVIKERYDESVGEIESGEITTEIFRDDVECSVADCLALMY